MKNTTEQVPSANSTTAVEEDNEDFVYIDDEGQPVPPEAEASCLMAAEFAELELANSTEWLMAAESEEQQKPLTIHMETNANVVNVIDQMLLEEQESQQQQTEVEEDSLTATPSTTEEKTKDDALVEEEEEEEDEAEFNEMGSRGFSDIGEEEEWVLDAITNRRFNKTSQTFEYLCRWKWYSQCTWEEKEWLEDQGHGKEVAAMDKEKGPKKKNMVNVKNLKKKEKELALNSIEKRFPKLIDDVTKLFKDSRARLIRYAPTLDRSPIATRRFLLEWQKEPEATPVVLFHGTRERNISSILNRGLCVPGRSGVRVAHGSAYGVGIYSARTPDVPFGYCSGGNKMFVCLGLLSPDVQKTRSVNNICVFFDEARILPLWIAEFDRSGDCNIAPERVTLSEMMKNVAGSGPAGNYSTMPGVPIVSGFSKPAGVFISSTADGSDVAVDKVPRELMMKGVSKKMLRQAPRKIKEAYRQGVLPNKKD